MVKQKRLVSLSTLVSAHFHIITHGRFSLFGLTRVFSLDWDHECVSQAVQLESYYYATRHARRTSLSWEGFPYLPSNVFFSLSSYTVLYKPLFTLKQLYLMLSFSVFNLVELFVL